MSSLLAPLLHLPLAVPAIAAFGILSVATLDTLSWQGRVGALVVDGVNRFSAEHRSRIVHHEAGHFLAAYLLDIPVTGYTLSAWEAFREGLPGLGGVRFGSEELDTAAQEGVLSSQLLDRYCTVLMAGIAAETLVYDQAEGGGDDRLKFRMLWSQLRRPEGEGEQKLQWAAFQAKNLLNAHRSTYDALVTAMEQRTPLAECYQIIEQQIQASLQQDVVID